MGAKILQFYEKCKSCPELFASRGENVNVNVNLKCK